MASGSTCGRVPRSIAIARVTRKKRMAIDRARRSASALGSDRIAASGEWLQSPAARIRRVRRRGRPRRRDRRRSFLPSAGPTAEASIPSPEGRRSASIAPAASRRGAPLRQSATTGKGGFRSALMPRRDLPHGNLGMKKHRVRHASSPRGPRRTGAAGESSSGIVISGRVGRPRVRRGLEGRVEERHWPVLPRDSPGRGVSPREPSAPPRSFRRVFPPLPISTGNKEPIGAPRRSGRPTPLAR